MPPTHLLSTRTAHKCEPTEVLVADVYAQLQQLQSRLIDAPEVGGGITNKKRGAHKLRAGATN
jgi:hypothetical protein